MSHLVLKLKASYFKNATFISNSDCPVAKAIKSQLQALDVRVLTYAAHINGDLYKLSYWTPDFFEDLEKAQDAGFGDSIIRELTLERVDGSFQFEMSSPHEN